MAVPPSFSAPTFSSSSAPLPTSQWWVATGRSGFTSWVPVADEDGVASALAAAGWAVAPGQRFRIAAPPGIRISFARLAEADAPSFASGLARALRHRASRLD